MRKRARGHGTRCRKRAWHALRTVARTRAHSEHAKTRQISCVRECKRGARSESKQDLERVGNRRIVHNDHLAQVLPNRADVFEKIAVLPARMQKRSKCACKMRVLSCSLHWWPRGTGGLVALVPWLHSWPLAAACHQPSLAPWLKLMHALAWRQGRQAGTHANRA